jgi:hypothetical protein
VDPNPVASAESFTQESRGRSSGAAGGALLALKPPVAAKYCRGGVRRGVRKYVRCKKGKEVCEEV